MTVNVYVDWSNIAHMSHSVAVRQFGEDPERYSLLEIFQFNLNSKLRHLSHHLLESGYFDCEFIFVLDENSRRKIMLYPDYKAHRSHSDNPMPLKEATEFIREKGYGRFCYSPDNEADDTIATLVNDGEGGVVISADKDLWQLLDNNVTILNPMTKNFIGIDDLYKAFQLEQPCHIPLYKALWGDAGDGVPNAVPRMQKWLIPVIKKTDGTLEGFRAALKASWWGLSKRCRDLYAENERTVLTNFELVSLDRFCDIIWE